MARYDSPSDRHTFPLSDLDAIDRFVEPPVSGPLCDVLWAHPLHDENGNLHNSKESEEHTDRHTPPDWVKNEARGCSYYYSAEAVRKFLERNNIKSIVRAHEVLPTVAFLAPVTLAPTHSHLFRNFSCSGRSKSTATSSTSGTCS